ncbi:hypothetical protein ACGC1H_004365 [Rhizoctonia solani]|uniref:Uncharacterized protein n=1 Tax=Rhizoctonia solani TaxID=456999 RepID=A0A8H2WPP6_9AGAM|nr:unnamed protein product [Rhizoctonia solani]
MFFGTISIVLRYGVRGMATKASKHPNNFKPKASSAPELASLAPEPVCSLQQSRVKRGTIRPILNQEPIKSGARIDPTHPAAALSDKSFRAPYATHDYFSTRAYPNAMLKRLGVVIEPNGRFKPRPPPEREFPIFKQKRIKFARTYVVPIKSTHKSGVVRVRLKRKLNEAIRLVVTRGADADHQANKLTFKQSEALESKWLLRDWYYVFYPRVPIYHAPWPSLIQAVRESFLAVLKQGREMDMRWNLEIADREAKAMARLSRREMRRARMWRRQDQETVSRGHISEDVGIRWKLEGTGPKKRLVGKMKPSVGNRGAKVLRAPSRGAFQRGNAANPSAGSSAPRKAVVPKLENSPGKATPPPRLTTRTKPQVEATRAGAKPQISQNSHTTRTPPSTKLPSITPKLSKGKLKASGKPHGPIFTMPPTESLVDSLRRKPLSKLASESGLKSPNHTRSLSRGGSNTPSTFKRET